MCTMLSTVGVVTVMGTYGFEYDCDIAIDGGVGYGLVGGFLIGTGGTVLGQMHILPWSGMYLCWYVMALVALCAHLHMCICCRLPGFWCFQMGAGPFLGQATPRASPVCRGVCPTPTVLWMGCWGYLGDKGTRVVTARLIMSAP